MCIYNKHKTETVFNKYYDKFYFSVLLDVLSIHLLLEFIHKIRWIGIFRASTVQRQRYGLVIVYLQRLIRYYHTPSLPHTYFFKDTRIPNTYGTNAYSSPHIDVCSSQLVRLNYFFSGSKM